MSRLLDRERDTLMDTFHRHRLAGEHDLAAAALERAMQTPEYRPEAFIWKGIDALPVDPKLAFIFLSNAAQAFPLRADVQALVGRSVMAQGQSELAKLYLVNAWKKLPQAAALRMMLWQARSECEPPEKLRSSIVSQLPDIDAPHELAFLLNQLGNSRELSGCIGVVRYLPDVQEIQGWAVDLNNPQAPAALQLEANGHIVNIVANVPCPLLASAGLPANHGGIRVKVPNPIPALEVRFASGPGLSGSPLYAMPAFKPPPPAPDSKKNRPVDVLIPVFNGLEETLECIQSAIDARKMNRIAHRLVVIEDMTPVPALRKALKVLADKGRITLIHNPVNLGFIRSMNRAMALSPTKDVVWLNADTRVHGNWLDRLQAVAYSDTKIASVTPFTNNGELMSFPESRFSHPMPSAQEQSELDELARLTNSLPIEIETGCGFCLYLKRSAIDEVGYLDEAGLSRGYGEETDWCLRARGLGWHHMGAPGVFVAHQGGISFGEEKLLRVAHNNAILKHRYPEASARFEEFCLRDPIKPARQALQRARLAQLAKQIAAPDSPLKHLHIGNDHGSEALLTLTWCRQGSNTLITLHAEMTPLALRLDYQMPADHQKLSDDLRRLPIVELIYENLTGAPAHVYDLPELLGTPYRITCRDDELLSKDTAMDWQAFATLAKRIDLPWTALRGRYTAALPNAKFSITSRHLNRALPAETTAPRTFLVADDLHDAYIADEWLNLARHITREKLALRLLIHKDGPWRQSLLSTGAIHVLPLLDGLTLAQSVQLADCSGALSLDKTPGAGWSAPEVAELANLPLYAIPSLIADEAGAKPMPPLPIYRAVSDVR